MSSLNPDAAYLVRLAKVGAVVLAVAVLAGFVYNAQQRTAPAAAAPVNERPPVLLIENARIVDEEEAVDDPASADRFREPPVILPGDPLVPSTLRPDVAQERIHVPPAPSPSLPQTGTDPYISSSKSSLLLHAPSTEPAQNPDQVSEKPGNR